MIFKILLELFIKIHQVKLAFRSVCLLLTKPTLYLTLIPQSLFGGYFQIFPRLDKGSHEEPFYKLETFEVKGEVLNLLRNYLHECYQRVVLNDQRSSWEQRKSGITKLCSWVSYVSYV